MPGLVPEILFYAAIVVLLFWAVGFLAVVDGYDHNRQRAEKYGWRFQFLKAVKCVRTDSGLYGLSPAPSCPATGVVGLPAGVQEGRASWYAYDLAGAPGYSDTHDTAASRDWPRGTRLVVERLDKPDKSVIVRVNDWVENPDVVIDLSNHAFQQLAPLSLGIIRVRVRPID